MKYNYKNSGKGLYVFFAVTALVLFLLMASVIPFLANSKKMPGADMLLCLVCVISAFAQRRPACIFALVLGVFSDLFLFSPTAFSPVIYLTASLITPIFHRYFSRLGSIVLAVCCVPAIVLRILVNTVAARAVFDGASFWDVIATNALPALLINFAFAIAICFICRRLISAFGLKY